jgi:hypothetical protein
MDALIRDVRKHFQLAQVLAHGVTGLGVDATDEQVEALGFALLDFAIAAGHLVVTLLGA